MTAVIFSSVCELKSIRKAIKCIENYRSVIRQIDTENCLQKDFSICLLEQEILNRIKHQPELIEDERTSCILRCVVKDLTKVKDFCNELEKEVKDHPIEKTLMAYGTLGSDDCCNTSIG